MATKIEKEKHTNNNIVHEKKIDIVSKPQPINKNNMIRCNKCQFNNNLDSNFCGMCGKSLSSNCSKCGHFNPPLSTFCNKCGFVLA